VCQKKHWRVHKESCDISFNNPNGGENMRIKFTDYHEALRRSFPFDVIDSVDVPVARPSYEEDSPFSSAVLDAPVELTPAEVKAVLTKPS
jgi:hypothetical protein